MGDRPRFPIHCGGNRGLSLITLASCAGAHPFDLLDRKKAPAGAFFISACGVLRVFA